MQEVKIKLSQKQHEAFEILNDKVTTELFYGGGAGGGKSFLGCIFLVYCCLKYPGTRYLMGRARLKILKESTLLTFFSVCREVFNLEAGVDYKYHMLQGKVTFLKTNSEVYLKDLFQYPSDPEFDSLGSTEYTAGFIDEVSEITEKAKNIVMSRLRFKLDEFNLIPKLLMASNPAKNFAYRDYWRPWSEGTLPEFRAFVPALVGDNPYMSHFYAENLKKLDENSKQRLLFGNWNYDDDPTRLLEYEEILSMFDIFYETDDNDLPYLSIDVARYGTDKTVIVQWRGFKVVKVHQFNTTSTKQIREMIEKICAFERIPRSHVIVDEDGVGGGVVDETKGVIGFVNGARPLELKADQTSKGAYTTPPAHNFANLKAQCYFLFARAIKQGKIFFADDLNAETKDFIIEDLQQMKVKDIDKEKKWNILSKEEIKESLGRSPDFADALMMRMYFTLKKKVGSYWAI